MSTKETPVSAALAVFFFIVAGSTLLRGAYITAASTTGSIFDVARILAASALLVLGLLAIGGSAVGIYRALTAGRP